LRRLIHKKLRKGSHNLRFAEGLTNINIIAPSSQIPTLSPLNYGVMNENLSAFEEHVQLRYQVFNSIFLTLNLSGVHRTGMLLPILAEKCRKGLDTNLSPDEIIEGFFAEQPEERDEQERIQMLFKFVQFIERQVVLVDALEDAAFARVNNLDGSGSFKAFVQTASNRNAREQLQKALQYFRIRVVLTAHPTQFYPGSVLGIITDLTEAVKTNDLNLIKKYLAQLGKTPFFQKEKPTAYDEAVRLSWYLENIFYQAIPAIYREAHAEMGVLAEDVFKDNPLIQMGFWPGGDRDGNPFVTVETTLRVADELRGRLLKSYFRDVRLLKRRITFRGAQEILDEIEKGLYESAFVKPKKPTITLIGLKKKLSELIACLYKDHSGLFAEDVEELLRKVKIFGFHFSTIDIRQDSRVISRTYDAVVEKTPKEHNQKKGNTDTYFNFDKLPSQPTVEDPILNDTFKCFAAMRQIQKRNGPAACYRYIISNCRGVDDVARTFAMAKMSGMGKRMIIDIIPLFETIDDLQNAGEVMDELYRNKTYRSHVRFRKNKQIVMLGFSDGTKDGGYITANWGIFRAKEEISRVSRQHGVQVVFFDGRGGPPARGGGNTHKFYASLGPTIESNQIQITIQGQTISSNFGTIESAKYNLEQLLTAGLENKVLDSPYKVLNEDQRKLLDELSAISYRAYQDFKAHPLFMPYLEKMSTLKYYAETNIGSRPAKRGKSTELKFEDLRAIPFVGAWSQLKQNVPGFYGLGRAFEKIDKAGRLEELKSLYRNSLFFRTLLENSMQSLSKTNFNLTQYMERDPEFGQFWKQLYDESMLSRKYLLIISGQSRLLDTNPAIRSSIELREQIVLPLLIIQQYALMKIKEMDRLGKGQSPMTDAYRKLVVRSLYGNINASRNSA
jgi:phosphoenolpyruvate carboxylase